MSVKTPFVCDECRKLNKNWYEPCGHALDSGKPDPGGCLWCKDKDAEIASLRGEVERLREERDDALATQIPPDSGAIRKLGERLTDILDEDDWNGAERLLLAAQQALSTAEQENERLRGKVLDLQDGHDLHCDEFDRIRKLTNDVEIQGLCSRAIKIIHQKVPVIVQRDEAEKSLAALKAENERLRGKVEKAIQMLDKWSQPGHIHRIEPYHVLALKKALSQSHDRPVPHN